MSIYPNSENDTKNYTQTNKSLPFYMRLYPPLSETSTESQSEFHNMFKIDSDMNNMKHFLGKEETDVEDELTQDFLDDLVKPNCLLPKSKIIDVVSKAILKSKLIEKIEDDNKTQKKTSQIELSTACAKKFTYVLIKKGENVFRIGDIGDKFYYILKGKVNILKIKEIPNLYMSIMEYLNYCLFLLKAEENYLFQEVIQRNYHILQVTNAEEVLSLYKISFKRSLQENILQHLIYTNKLLDEYFKAFDQNYYTYEIDKRELDILEFNKNKKLPGSYKEWQNYIIKKCELNTNELVLYEPFEQLIKDKKKKKIVCFIYESFLYLGPGLYFGDFALDSEVNKRNATIRAEEDSYFGWLRTADYLNMIAPKRRYEKMKEIAFLFNSFFFHNINPHSFERNYFHLFYLREYPRGTVLFYSGKLPKNLYLVKDGQISIDLKCSVMEIHKLIKFLYNKITTNSIFSKFSKSRKNLILPPETINRIHKYFKEPKLERLKMQNNEFIKEMNKIKIFHITLVIGVEAVGQEDIFMKIPYLVKATAVKTVKCYEFAVDQIEKLLKEEKEIRFSFVMSSVRKILSLIERLQGIKKNCVEMANSKYNSKSESIFEKAFSSTQYFPIIPNRNNKNNINKTNKTREEKNQLILKDDINYNDNIYNILNKTNSNRSKSKEKNDSKTKEKNVEVNQNISSELQKNEKNKKNGAGENRDDSITNYKKIRILNIKDKSRNFFTSYKSPIRDFIINKNSDYKTILFSLIKNSKSKNSKFFSYNQRKKKNNNAFNAKDMSEDKNLESSNEKDEESPSKNKLDTGMKVNNLFLLGDKYYTIKKLKKQIKNFNSLENNKKTLEIIQSNQINNEGYIMPNDMKNIVIKKMNAINSLNIKTIKKNFIKFSQEFKNFHLSFVPISVGEKGKNNNIINEESNCFLKNFHKNSNYSTFSEKFFANKTMKNYFLVAKKNKQCMKRHINRVNSDFSKYTKDILQIKKDFFNNNVIQKNKNHFSSQIYSNKIISNNNKTNNGFIRKINIKQ